MTTCTCVYATAANTPSVRLGHEVGGYLKHYCGHCYDLDVDLSAPTEEDPEPNTVGELIDALRKLPRHLPVRALPVSSMTCEPVYLSIDKDAVNILGDEMAGPERR